MPSIHFDLVFCYFIKVILPMTIKKSIFLYYQARHRQNMQLQIYHFRVLFIIFDVELWAKKAYL
ncbi:MAG: hypothetical protein EA394_04305 [Bacteroidia bacterium]|nr:MAG: hypothetical protein EA394_04305 [Bacteroidia bacterium]